MPSSKGKPTDPKLKEKVTEEVKAKPNKDGSGKGQMAAWKAAQIGKEYEARGGDYENEPGSKNQPKKGPPEKKSEDTKSKESKAETNGDDKATEKKAAKPKKESKPKKEPRKGTRSSARQAEASTAAGEKRKSTNGDGKESAKKAKK